MCALNISLVLQALTQGAPDNIEPPTKRQRAGDSEGQLM